MSKGFFTFKDMALPNHNTDNVDYSVYEMVRERLPYITDNADNKKLISRLTLQLMYELEGCFKVSVLDDGTVDKSRIGDENYYSVVMRSILADLVAYYILLVVATGSGTIGNDLEDVTQSAGTYLKKAKAGSAEVEYDQLDMKKNTAVTKLGTDGLLGLYKASAIRKAHTLGCLIDLNEDGSVELFLDTTINVPFINIGGCGCC